MRLSYQWLQEYVDLGEMTPQTLAEALTNVGLEVEGVEPRAVGLSGVVVGEVVEVQPHPNADRLRVCQVNVGEPELYTIVCGAPNVAPGQRVPTALPGAVLPGGSISKAKLRGVESAGMLCSAEEIGLETRLLPKEQTDGLYVLPKDAPIGGDVVKLLALDDVVLDISLTSNRSDCLSMRGLAYEVAAILDKSVRFPVVTDGLSAEQSPVKVQIETDRCSRYEAQVLEGVRIQPAPLWLQMRLLAMGVRPINSIVDITNYVMLEWGQPLHAFDLDQVHGQTIVVRQAKGSEKLQTLDGEARELTDDTIVISDVERAIGIAGVMGGLNSEITSDTTRVVLESAAFDAPSTRRTGQRLGLRSEAQQRFEKGIDPEAIHGALLRATELLHSIAGAAVVGQPVVVYGTKQTTRPEYVEFRPSRCNELLGTEIAATEMRRIFARLGFEVDGSDSNWLVRVPTRRGDISIEADLIEEVGRLFGYDAIPSTLPLGATTSGVRNKHQKLRKRTREVLIGAGLTEVFTYTFGHPAALDALRIEPESPYRRMIPLMWPMSEERVALRTHLLPGLAQVARYNLARGLAGGEVFEIGRVYWPDALPLTEPPAERTQWAGLWFGDTEPDVGERPRRYDFYDAKGVVEAWLDAMGWLSDSTFTRAEATWLHPGRSAEVLYQGTHVGKFGELHPETAAALEVTGAVYAEFDLDVLSGFIDASWLVERLPKYPASRRDLAVIIDTSVPAQDLLDIGKQVSNRLSENILESCNVFDVYTGKGIDPGKKSVAVAFTYRADERTLTDDEIAAVESEIVSAWERELGAVLRAGK